MFHIIDLLHGLVIRFDDLFMVVSLLTKNKVLLYLARKFPLTITRGEWSIGMLRGRSPFTLGSPGKGENPVLSAKDVEDVDALHVADPFMVRSGSNWFLFFEVFNAETLRGEIGYATSRDGSCFAYSGIVLREDVHLSYPQVFEWQGRFWMIPESIQGHRVRLYESTDFPRGWVAACDLIIGDYLDPTIFRFENSWFLFAAENHDVLRLYHAENLFGPWIEHPSSPVTRGQARARPGGRIIDLSGEVYMFTQDCHLAYGRSIRAVRITKLSRTDYAEEDNGEVIFSLSPREGWRPERHHHLDPHRIGDDKWIACVDGYEEFIHPRHIK